MRNELTNKLMGYINEKIAMLDKPTPWAKASLARLRRGIGKAPNEVPEVWPITLGNLDEELAKSLYAENAIHAVLTLYALHKQGKDISLHSSGQKAPGFGHALARLRSGDSDKDAAIVRRFNTLATADDLVELTYHARGLIQLLRASDTPVMFDYARLAKELCDFQISAELRRKVIFNWGVAFYKTKKSEDNNHE